MKKMRRLIPAFAMLLVAATMLSTASFAWFTMSTTAKATGMQVQATADSTLLITLENTLAKFEVAGGSVEFEDDATSLQPATHYDSEKHGTVNTSTGLVTAADPSTVTAATGHYTGEYKEAGTGYYVDYVIYLGATGTETIKGQDLSVTVSIANNLAYELHNAVSIDFYVAAGNAETVGDFGGTINLKDVDDTNKTADNKHKIAIKQNFDITPAVSFDDQNAMAFDGSKTFKVTMRVYFDGALEKTAATGDNEPVYYVRNAQAVTDAIGFGVQFDIADTTVTGS